MLFFACPILIFWQIWEIFKASRELKILFAYFPIRFSSKFNFLLCFHIHFALTFAVHIWFVFIHILISLTLRINTSRLWKLSFISISSILLFTIFAKSTHRRTQILFKFSKAYHHSQSACSWNNRMSQTHLKQTLWEVTVVFTRLDQSALRLED